MAELRWGAASDAGQLRSQNEDNQFAGPGLFVVADGMGGHLAGEVASEMAVTQLSERLPDSTEHTLDDLVQAIDDANTDIYEGSVTNPDQAGMGTTVTAIAVVADPHDGEAFGVANVGDSRGYVMRHGRLRQITIDHSFVQELVAEGAITRDEARVHPRRNIVTRALGIEPMVRVDSWTMPIIRGDRFVLCSDGLVDEITDQHITEILATHQDDPDAAAQALVDAANEAGGRDNVTVVVVDVLEGDDPPDPTEEFDVLPLWIDEDEEDTGEVQIIADPSDPAEADVGGATVMPAASARGDATPTDAAAPSVGAAASQSDGVIVATAPTDAAPADAAPADAAPTGRRVRRRIARIARFLLVLGVAAVIVLGFAILAAWARQGYFVAFDDDGQVGIYQGRSVLWFEPTLEATGPFDREQLDEESVDLVYGEPDFESQGSAERYVAERLSPTTTTTTTTTTVPVTTAPAVVEGETTEAIDDGTDEASSEQAPDDTTATATTSGG